MMGGLGVGLDSDGGGLMERQGDWGEGNARMMEV